MCDGGGKIEFLSGMQRCQACFGSGQLASAVFDVRIALNVPIDLVDHRDVKRWIIELLEYGFDSDREERIVYVVDTDWEVSVTPCIFS